MELTAKKSTVLLQWEKTCFNVKMPSENNVLYIRIKEYSLASRNLLTQSRETISIDKHFLHVCAHFLIFPLQIQFAFSLKTF